MLTTLAWTTVPATGIMSGFFTWRGTSRFSSRAPPLLPPRRAGERLSSRRRRTGDRERLSSRRRRTGELERLSSFRRRGGERSRRGGERELEGERLRGISSLYSRRPVVGRDLTVTATNIGIALSTKPYGPRLRTSVPAAVLTRNLPSSIASLAHSHSIRSPCHLRASP